LQTTKTKGDDTKELSLALNRVGHHIRETIVEEARASLGNLDEVHIIADSSQPEPIPEDQEEINRQADAAIRDLFPRIPNGDRQTIIEHAFKKVGLTCFPPEVLQIIQTSFSCAVLRVR
jgi:hypothetical protein